MSSSEGSHHDLVAFHLGRVYEDLGELAQDLLHEAALLRGFRVGLALPHADRHPLAGPPITEQHRPQKPLLLFCCGNVTVFVDLNTVVDPFLVDPHLEHSRVHSDSPPSGLASIPGTHAPRRAHIAVSPVLNSIRLPHHPSYGRESCRSRISVRRTGSKVPGGHCSAENRSDMLFTIARARRRRRNG